MQISSGPIGSIDPNKPIHIYGAGIAGLLMAYYFKRAKYTVRVYEKSSRVGGKIGTLENEYGIAETAANAIYTNDDVFELLTQLNLNYSVATPKLKRKVWRNGRAMSPPFRISELIKILFNIFKRIPFKNIHELSVADFFGPLTGKQFVNEVISSALGGIYAEDANKLHFQSIFKLPIKPFSFLRFFLNLKKSRKEKTKATSISFDGGMQTFIDTLHKELQENIFLNESPKLDSLANNIICTDAHNAANLLEAIHPKASSLLKSIQYNSLQTSTFITSTPVSFLHQSFGVLFPHFLQQKAIGLLNNSAIFSNRTKHKDHSSYTMITKTKGETNSAFSEINALDEFIARTHLSKDQIVFQKTTPWPVAIPIYDKHRYDTILSLRSTMIEVTSGLVLFGNYIDGISIREMISMAKKFSQSSAVIQDTTAYEEKTTNSLT